LEETEAALRRIDQGSYGACAGCHTRISRARLGRCRRHGCASRARRSDRRRRSPARLPHGARHRRSC
jgi:RNA polymerase-binding transcription factor DksA